MASAHNVKKKLVIYFDSWLSLTAVPVYFNVFAYGKMGRDKNEYFTSFICVDKHREVNYVHSNEWESQELFWIMKHNKDLCLL
jgi:hypothetical protein